MLLNDAIVVIQYKLCFVLNNKFIYHYNFVHLALCATVDCDAIDRDRYELCYVCESDTSTVNEIQIEYRVRFVKSDLCKHDFAPERSWSVQQCRL